MAAVGHTQGCLWSPWSREPVVPRELACFGHTGNGLLEAPTGLQKQSNLCRGACLSSRSSQRGCFCPAHITTGATGAQGPLLTHHPHHQTPRCLRTTSTCPVAFASLPQTGSDPVSGSAQDDTGPWFRAAPPSPVLPLPCLRSVSLAVQSRAQQSLMFLLVPKRSDGSCGGPYV